MTRKIAWVAQWVFVAALMFSVFGVVPSQAADPTTIASATMIFEGTLDGNGDGTLAMIDEGSRTDVGDGEGGFDVYARNGAIAMYDKAGSGSEDYEHGPVSGHDAYNTGGGWGSTYNPDCADWNHYQLRIDGTKWYLEYASGGTTYAYPMAGRVDWDHGTDGYAVEKAVGSYYSGTGTPESDGYALSNPWTNGDGKAAWDMDWSWGSEYIPLEYPGFDVDIELNVDGDTDRVTLTPAAMPVWLEFADGKDWIEVGGTKTVNVMMSGSGFNGVELDLIYQDAYLDGGDVSEGSMWSGYSSNVMQNETSSGHVYFKDYVIGQDETLGGTHMQVAQFDLVGQADHDDATITLQNRIKIIDLDGKQLPVSGEDDTLTVHGTATVQGDVQLQGRFVGGGDSAYHAGATVTLTGGPGGGFSYTGSTNASGHWSIPSVVEGDYDAKVEMELYVDAESPDYVTVVHGATADAGFVKLLGGDCNLPGNNTVGSGDASVVASTFGLSFGDGGYDDDGDINDDNKVDVLDCAILGGNYGLTGPTTAPW